MVGLDGIHDTLETYKANVKNAVHFASWDISTRLKAPTSREALTSACFSLWYSWYADVAALISLIVTRSRNGYNQSRRGAKNRPQRRHQA